jgi:hypothetical protein
VRRFDFGGVFAQEGLTVVELAKEVSSTRMLTEQEVLTALDRMPEVTGGQRELVQAEISALFDPKLHENGLLSFEDRAELSEREILNQLVLNNPQLDSDFLDELDNHLDSSVDSASLLGDTKVVILETHLQSSGGVIPAHSGIVEELIKQQNPALQANEVISVGAYQAGGTISALTKLADLSERIKQEGGEAPVVNMSFEVGLFLYDLESIENLGYPAGTTMEDVCANPELLRKSLDDRAATGDLDAIEALKTADALVRLANTGAKIQVAWGNANGLNVVGVLTQGHHNITYVAAVDGDGGLSQTQSPTTGQFAETKAIGNVIHLPKSLEGQVDEESLDGAVAQYNLNLAERTSELKFLGMDPTLHTLTKEQFAELAEQVDQMDAAIDVYYQKDAISLLRETYQRDGMFDELSVAVLEENKDEFNSALSALGVDDSFSGDLFEDAKRILMNDDLAVKLEAHFQAQLSVLPFGDRLRTDEDVLVLEDAMTQKFSNRLLTRDQLQTLAGSSEPFGALPSDTSSDNHDYAEVTNLLSVLRGDGGFESYTAVRTVQGTLVLGLQTEGTSWSAPVVSGQRVMGGED